MEVSDQIHGLSTLLPGKDPPPGTHWIGGWVGPSTSLDNMEERKILPLSGLELWSSALQPIAGGYTNCAICALL
jgi:hypothetical protein